MYTKLSNLSIFLLKNDSFFFFFYGTLLPPYLYSRQLAPHTHNQAQFDIVEICHVDDTIEIVMNGLCQRGRPSRGSAQ